MSTEDNKAIAKQLLDAWNQNDFATIEDLFASDYVNHNPPPMPGARGDREGQIQIMRYFREAFPDGGAETLNLVAEGDKVVLHDKVSGTQQGEFMGVPATGREVTIDFIHIFRIANGKIAERWGLVDAMSLMTQLGAIPAPQPAGAEAGTRE